MSRWVTEWLWIVLPIGLAGLQASFFNSLPWFGGVLQLVFLAAVVSTLTKGAARGSQVALIGAFTLDLFSAMPFGLFLVAHATGLAIFLVGQGSILKNSAFHAYAINLALATIGLAVAWNGLVWLSTLISLTKLRPEFGQTLSLVLAQVTAHLILLAITLPLLSRFRIRPVPLLT